MTDRVRVRRSYLDAAHGHSLSVAAPSLMLVAELYSLSTAPVEDGR